MAVMKRTGQDSESIWNAPRSGLAAAGRHATRPVVHPSPLQAVAAGILNGVSPVQFMNGINAANQALGNRSFLQWVGDIQSGGWEAVAPLQLMGKKKKKQEAPEVEAKPEAAATGKVGTGTEGTVAPGPDGAQPQVSGTTPGVEPEQVGGAAGGAKKKKKKSRVQVALNTLRGEGVAAFRSYIEAEIGETELLRTLVERIMRAEDLGAIRKAALVVVEGRLRVFDPEGATGVPGAGGQITDALNRGREPEIAEIAPARAVLTLRERDLFDASIKGDTVKLMSLLRHRNVDINMGVEGGTMLCAAVFNGRLNIVRELLSRPGINVNLAQRPAATPLFLAAQEGHVKIVELLLNKDGINVNLATITGATPLYMAIQQGHVEVVKLLLGAPGIHVNLVTSQGGTPLLLAAQYGYEEVVKLLLAVPGIDIDTQRKPDGGTALYMAAQKNFPGIVEQLVRRGADVNLGLNDSSTPLGIAADRGQLEVVRILLQVPAINIDKATNTGITPLSIAVQRGHKQVIKLLLRKEADLVVADQTGANPLHFACLNGHSAIVGMLLNAGADPDVEFEDPDSKTLIQTSYSLAELGGHREVMSILAAHRRSREAALRLQQLSITQVPGEDTGTSPTVSRTELEGEQDAATLRGSSIPPTPSPPGEAVAGTEPPTPLAQAKDTLRQEVLDKIQTGNFKMLEGIRLLQDINATDDMGGLCALYNRLAHMERLRERARRLKRCQGLLSVSVGAEPAAAGPAVAPVFALGEKTGLDADAVEHEIKRYLSQKNQRFVSQAMNDIEFGRGKRTTGYAGLWHASAGIAGVGSCSVFYYLEGSGEKIRVVGIGHHHDAETYRLDYAAEELTGGGSVIRLS